MKVSVFFGIKKPAETAVSQILEKFKTKFSVENAVCFFPSEKNVYECYFDSILIM